MDYNEFLEKLNGVPQVDRAVDSLFEAALNASEQSFYLSILDVHVIENRGVRSAMIPSAGWNIAISQFGEFLGQVAPLDPSDVGDDLDPNFLRRLHMLAYSQSWEHVAIRRLLLQLVRICCGEKYDADLLWENWKQKDQSCASVYEQIISKAKKANQEIGDLIKVIYCNQIRNAFTHSQFYFVADLVCFENCDPHNPLHVPSLKLSTWDKLFRLTTEFVSALFRNRLAADKELRTKTVFEFDLPMLVQQRYRVILGERGEWEFADQ